MNALPPTLATVELPWISRTRFAVEPSRKACREVGSKPPALMCSSFIMFTKSLLEARVKLHAFPLGQ